jgi:hypothetical protein
VETRRTFLAGIVLVGACTGLAGNAARGQNPLPPQGPPRNPTGEHQDSDAPAVPAADKKVLENNDKDIKTKVERLYFLANELRVEVEKTDSSKVLSMTLVKKAEEIEKLAHDIKNRSKG